MTPTAATTIPTPCANLGASHVSASHRVGGDVAEAAGELPEPVDVGEGGGQAERGPGRPGGLPIDDLEEVLVAQPVLVLEGGRHLCGGKAERGLAHAGVAVAAAAQRDSGPA